MYNNPYMTNVSLNDRIDNEIERLKQMKNQVQQTEVGIKYMMN